MCLGFTTRCID